MVSFFDTKVGVGVVVSGLLVEVGTSEITPPGGRKRDDLTTVFFGRFVFRIFLGLRVLYHGLYESKDSF